jgi:hypothetical protein
MNRRTFVVACACLALSASTMFAQAKPKADAISGTWSGHLIPRGASASDGGVSVTLKLKFDGKSAVTGTLDGMPNPGEVKSGTFDPKTGALKLQLGVTTETNVRLTLDGSVVKDKATGKMSGEQSGTFTLTKKS